MQRCYFWLLISGWTLFDLGCEVRAFKNSLVWCQASVLGWGQSGSIDDVVPVPFSSTIIMVFIVRGFIVVGTAIEAAALHGNALSWIKYAALGRYLGKLPFFRRTRPCTFSKRLSIESRWRC